MPKFTAGEALEVHPLYASQRAARSFWRRSDAARYDYATNLDAAGNAILPQHNREPNDNYLRRRRTAIARAYVRPIIDRYNDFVNREPAQRPDAEDGTPYAQLLDDADGDGTPLASLMRRALRKAQVDAVSYLLADSNVTETFPSAAAEIAAGKRGIIRVIDPDQLVWWRVWNGHIVEAVICFQDRDGNDFAWYVTETTTQRIDLKRNEKLQASTTAQLTITTIHPPTPHTYGGCPLVPLSPIMTDDASLGEDSQASPIAEGQKRICNIDSWLHEEIMGATFTVTVFLGVSADQIKDVTVGPGQAMCLPSASGTGNPAVGKIGADPAQAASLLATLERETKELYRVAGLSPGNPLESGAPESGVSKAFAFNEIEAKCSSLADAAELAENTIIQRISSGYNFEYPGDADWPDEFSVADLGDELAKLLQMQSAALPPVLERAQIQRIANVGFSLDDDQKAELATELDAQQDFNLKVQQSKVVNPPADRTVGT